MLSLPPWPVLPCPCCRRISGQMGSKPPCQVKAGIKEKSRQRSDFHEEHSTPVWQGRKGPSRQANRPGEGKGLAGVAQQEFLPLAGQACATCPGVQLYPGSSGCLEVGPRSPIFLICLFLGKQEFVGSLKKSAGHLNNKKGNISKCMDRALSTAPSNCASFPYRGTNSGGDCLALGCLLSMGTVALVSVPVPSP